MAIGAPRQWTSSGGAVVSCARELRARVTRPDPRVLLARFEAILGRDAKRGVTVALTFSAFVLTAACGSQSEAPREVGRPSLANLSEDPSQGAHSQEVIGLRHPRLAAGSTTTAAAPNAEPITPAANLSGVERAALATKAPRRPTLRLSEPAEGQPALTELVAFESAPFPYDGVQPGRGPFLDVEHDGHRGHRARNGQVLWEDQTFNDRQVLVHVPKGFDPSKPAVMVIFFHGFGAMLARDVRDRYLVPAQISASGANAVLVAPQFAVDARDGSAGHFWEHGGFARFLDEAAHHLAHLHGVSQSEYDFKNMPVVLVAYSGGFLPAAYALRDVEHTGRLRGVMLLDAAYGELDTFAQWIAKEKAGFFVSACTNSTLAQNIRLKQMLSARGVSYSSNMDQVGRGVTFFNTGSEYTHRDYVTQAWVKNPIAELLARIPGVNQRDIRSASWEDASRDRVAGGAAYSDR